MNPNTAFSASLVTSLVLWYPSMQACLRGDLDLTPAALRYLAALMLSRLAMNFLARLLNSYRLQQQPTVPDSGTPHAAGGDSAAAATATPRGTAWIPRHWRPDGGVSAAPEGSTAAPSGARRRHRGGPRPATPRAAASVARSRG
jgi:hypothetical protein